MNKKLYYGLMFIFGAIVIGCAGYLAQYYLTTLMTDKQQHALADYVGETSQTTEQEAAEKPQIQEKYRTLYEMNADFSGWLSIPDTKIDYAVMCNREENEYYLRRNFDKEDSMAGMLFVENRCDIEKPSTNLIIYGHNMKAGTMFHDLLQYDDETFYQSHKYITFNTLYRDGTYEVIGAYYTNVNPEDTTVYRYYDMIEPETAEDYAEYINYVKARTPYETADAVYGDELITLSTCAYHTEDGRYVVVAKKVK